MEGEFWRLGEGSREDRVSWWEQLLSNTHLPWSVRVAKQWRDRDFEAWVRRQWVDDLAFTMAVNAKGVWLGSKFAIAQMMKQELPEEGSRGKIINIASAGGVVGLMNEPAYCASKGAAVNLTRQLAIDFAPEKINVNAICPGFLSTAMVRQFLEDPELNQTLHDLSPWPHLGTAEDVAKMAVYLASDDAEMVTGSIHLIDGGYTAG